MKILKYFLPSLLAVLMWLLAPVARAADSPNLQLTTSTRHVSLFGHLAFHVDVPGDLTFDQATQAEYQPLNELRSVGYTPDTYWYRFTLTRELDAQSEWVLALGAPYLNDVRVWLVSADGKFHEYQTGTHFPYDERPLQTRMFALRLNLHDTTPLTVYARVHSISAMNFSADVWQPDAFVADETLSNFYHGAYFGLLGIIVILYAFFGAWLRNGGLVAYAGYVATLILLYLGVNGYTAVVFAPTHSWVTDAVVGIGAIGPMPVGALMWSLLLDMKRHFPRFRYLYLSTCLVGTCLLPFTASGYYRIIAPLIYQAGILITFTSMVLIVILLRRQKSLELLLYLLATIVISLGMMIHIAMLLGWLQQSFLTTHVYQISSLLNVLIMSLGLAMRMRQIQRDKVLAEHAVVVAYRRADEQRNFVAMLSHEFRNPLAAIDRAAEMIQLKLPAMPPAEAERMTNIRAHVCTLSALVDNFLMSEALEHQAFALSVEDCPIRPLLEGVLLIFGETAAERVMLNVIPSEATFLLDQTLIGMAVGNLLGNALRYSPSDSKVELSADADDDGLTIRVTDHGYGLSKDELELLGMPYYRARSSLNTKGSGLGYYFSRRIVEAHGGSLHGYCPDEKGLEVVILLPAGGKIKLSKLLKY